MFKKLSRLLFYFIGLSSYASVSQATKLDCQIINNGTIVQKSQVSSAPGVKVKIGEAGGVVAYLTETSSEQFEIDAFVAGAEARLYSSGPLTVDHPLSATLWTRDQLASVECHR